VGESIPLGGRIIAVADAFSAMTNDRTYRPALPLERAWAELRAHSGTQFDPELVAVFEEVVDQEGNLRPLDPNLERTLSHAADGTASGADELHARLAMLPALAPMAVAVKAAKEDCPVAPAGEECAVVASGEGCEPVLPVDGSIAPSGSRQVA
jgi:hypothetical protein